MWRYECCPSEQKGPPGPLLERWNIECDTGSNCMGSNQLDTQLKETWGLRAARHMAPPDPDDVQWTNPVSWNWLFLFLGVKRWTAVLGGRGMKGGGCSLNAALSRTVSNMLFFRALSQDFCLGCTVTGLKWVTQERSLCVPVGRALKHMGLNRRGVQNERWKAEGSMKLVQRTLVREGVNVAKQKSRLKSDERQAGKKWELTRWKKDRK